MTSSNNNNSSLFNKNERIGNDDSYNTQQTIQNTNYHNYNMSNYFPDKSTNDTVYFANQHPSLFINGYHRGAGLGSNINLDSEFFINTERKNQNTPLIDLHQRMFLTVPYLGRGPLDVDLESTMRLGDTILKRESDTEVNAHYLPYHDKNQENRVKEAHYIADSTSTRIGINSKQINSSIDK